MKKIPLHYQILIAFIIALLLGVSIPASAAYLSWLGALFLRLLKMAIVPLVFSSVITGVINIGGAKNLGRIAFKTTFYYITTSSIAILTGLLLVNIFKPGVGADIGLVETIDKISAVEKPIGQTLLEIIPENIFYSLANMDMLGIIFFSIISGYFISQLNEGQNKTLGGFFSAFFELMMRITECIIKFAPIGIFGIVIGIVAEQAGDINSLLNIFSKLGVYILCVSLGLSIHMFITLPLIMRVIGKVDPIKHFQSISTVLMTAFSTSSSNGTLPITMETVEKKTGVSNRITSFTLPLGATVNMDGTALYECVAAIFIAQAYGIELTLTQQAIVVLTALLASIGTAGIPMAGLVTITIILTAIGLPLEGVGLILAVDRILDMFRTTVNVFSDTTGAVIVAKTEGEKLNIDL